MVKAVHRKITTEPKEVVRKPASLQNKLVAKLPGWMFGRGDQAGLKFLNVFALAALDGEVPIVTLYANGCTLVLRNCDPSLEQAWEDFDQGFRELEDAWRSEAALRAVYAIASTRITKFVPAEWFDS